VSKGTPFQFGHAIEKLKQNLKKERCNKRSKAWNQALAELKSRLV
jgi:hypothetical protein